MAAAPSTVDTSSTQRDLISVCSQSVHHTGQVNLASRKVIRNNIAAKVINNIYY